MRILFVGDIFGSAGRKILQAHFHDLVETRSIDLSIVNVENAAGGFGVTPAIAEEIFKLGADVLTSGNHIWDKREIYDYLASGANHRDGNARRLLRPANYPEGSPGFGVYEGITRTGIPYAVLNLQGRVFMGGTEDPFRAVDQLLEKIKAKVVVVDFHAEATSEKSAFGWYLDGRVTAVLGTHTHVPTADSRILPKGTAYQTDVGMTGPFDSVIGVQKELALHRFLTSMPAKFEAAKGDPRLCAVVIECDAASGRATAIERIMLAE